MSNFILCTVHLIQSGCLKSTRLRWAGHVARIEEVRSAFKALIGKPTGKRPLRRPRLRWEVNIRMDLKEMGINSRNWVDSAQNGDYWRAFCEYCIEPPDNISHLLKQLVQRLGAFRLRNQIIICEISVKMQYIF